MAEVERVYMRVVPFPNSLKMVTAPEKILIPLIIQETDK